ncbi:phosphatidylserine/phosphatidylglycerophosphate/cardiolipin synthase family protein [Dokdonella sp.]|uniref:phospholipase D-like domain-containing protein n=1 Tax=Dokdonella sp. TaxID=2291710 RepID=UPI0035288E87
MPALPLKADPARSSDPTRQLAAQALSRAAGAPLIGGNDVGLLIDGEQNFEAWRNAICSAEASILFENYIFRDDELARGLRDAMVAKARKGVQVCLIRDWMGCLGQSTERFWQPLIEAGGAVRTFNPPSLGSPLGWLSRDHRKLVVVDSSVGFLGGVCVSSKWLGDVGSRVQPWRDTGVSVRGPAVRELVAAFADTWARLGAPLPESITDAGADTPKAGDIDLRVIATIPNAAGLYRLDLMIAAMARSRLWLTDAYFVGVAPYVQALSAAARDEVDVRLLVPGTSDIPAIGSLSRSGYRPLLEAGVRVFEWNGSMLHAKTAVADGRWARVGSSNLNLASWMGNCELDIAVEDRAFAERMEQQYEMDLENATEIVLGGRRVRRNSRRQPRTSGVRRKGSTGRAAAGALRLANTMGAAITNRRVLGPAESYSLGTASLFLGVTGITSVLWPRLLAWPVGALAIWFSLVLFGRFLVARRKSAMDENPSKKPE